MGKIIEIRGAQVLELDGCLEIDECDMNGFNERLDMLERAESSIKILRAKAIIGNSKVERVNRNKRLKLIRNLFARKRVWL